MIIPTDCMHLTATQHMIWSKEGLGTKEEDTFNLGKLTTAQKSRNRLAEIGARFHMKSRGKSHIEKSMWELRPAWATKNNKRDSMYIGRHV